MPRRLGESKNQEVDRARAKMQHQDQQELHNYGGPQQYPSRVYSDETRLTHGAARPGLSDCQAAPWTMASLPRAYCHVSSQFSESRVQDARARILPELER